MLPPFENSTCDCYDVWRAENVSSKRAFPQESATMTPEAIQPTKLLFKITAGNLKHHQIYIRKHLDFFPPDCVGPAKRTSKTAGKGIEIVLDGLNEVIETDICVDPKTGKPRFFRRASAHSSCYQQTGYGNCTFRASRINGGHFP
jgi:hypothetical protein